MEYRMVNRLLLTVIIAGAVLIAGCTSGQSSSGPEASEQDPNDVVRLYISSFVNGDIESAYDTLSSELHAEERTERLEQKRDIERIQDQMSFNSWSVEIHRVETVSENESIAEVEIELDLYAMDRYVETIERPVEVVKENGVWRLTEAPNPYSQDGNNIVMTPGVVGGS